MPPGRLLSLFLSSAVFGLGFLGCSSSPPEGASDPIAELKSRFDGQAIAIIPFKLDDPACQDDPETMLASVLASCAYMTDASGIDVTEDPQAFDLNPQRKMMLVVYGAILDSERPGWVGIAGLGPIAGGEATLVKASAEPTTALHPDILPLIVIGGYELLEAAVAAGIIYYGAKAVVTTAQVMNQQRAEAVVQRTQPIVERQSKLINCTPDEHELLKQQKDVACDPGQLPGDCSRSDAMTSSYCLQLDLRRGEYQKCKDARQNVTDKCFGGANDAAHQAQIDTMTRSIQGCDQLISASCGG
jgi:hypothetical protein